MNFGYKGGYLAAAFLAFTVPAQANVQLVTNGGFETLTNGPGQMGYNTNATGWTTTGYNFVFAAGTGDTTGSSGQYGGLTLWGPNNGSANGLPASSPKGGNYVGADGDYETEAITQTISGLTSGANYVVSFYWAGAQQSGFGGTNTEQWVVGFGGDPTQSTPVYTNTSHGFSGWQSESFTFQADGTSDVLSFLAVGSPAGVPPFSLLDGVSVMATPEPGYLVPGICLLGFMGVVGFLRSRKVVAGSLTVAVRQDR
jgi:hypothetical protein